VYVFSLLYIFLPIVFIVSSLHFLYLPGQTRQHLTLCIVCSTTVAFFFSGKVSTKGNSYLNLDMDLISTEGRSVSPVWWSRDFLHTLHFHSWLFVRWGLWAVSCIVVTISSLDICIRMTAKFKPLLRTLSTRRSKTCMQSLVSVYFRSIQCFRSYSV
jgi:hypothetical protein